MRQQFQITPDINRYDNEFGGFFSEDVLWPIPDRRYKETGDDIDDDDDDDDDTSNDNGNSNPITKELDDAPILINMDWRSTSGVQYNRQWFKYLRSSIGYALMHDTKRTQHSFRIEIDYRPLRHWKGKRIIDISARVGLQTTGYKRKKNNAMKWDTQLAPRIDVVWNFQKDHTLTWSNGLGGLWDNGIFLFDRWRSNINLNFIYRKNHRFVFGFQRQQRLDKQRISYGMSWGYEYRF